MAESAIKSLYGINDIRGYSRTTGESLFHLRVLGDVNAEFNAEIEKLMGGSQNFAWDTAIKEFKASLKVTCREYNPDAMTTLLGGSLTEYAPDVDGAVLTPANVKGTSVISATTGVATVTITTAADAKEGWYLLKAASSTTVDIYAYSNADFSRGTDTSFYDDDGKLIAAATTITASTGSAIANYGITLTGGSGTIGMTIGDTARFYVQKPSTAGGFKIKFGQAAATFDDIGVVIGGQTQSEEVTFLHFYKCKCAGMSMPFKEKGYAQYDFTIEPSYDTTLDGIGEFIRSSL